MLISLVAIATRPADDPDHRDECELTSLAHLEMRER
jgi:hypothetical protein